MLTSCLLNEDSVGDLIALTPFLGSVMLLGAHDPMALEWTELQVIPLDLFSPVVEPRGPTHQEVLVPGLHVRRVLHF